MADQSIPTGEVTPAAIPSSNDIPPDRLAPSAEAFREPGNHRFRKKYRKLNEVQAALSDAIKDKAGELADLLDKVKASRAGDGGVRREIALAHTHLEDSVMRGIRGLTA